MQYLHAAASPGRQRVQVAQHTSRSLSMFIDRAHGAALFHSRRGDSTRNAEHVSRVRSRVEDGRSTAKPSLE